MREWPCIGDPLSECVINAGFSSLRSIDMFLSGEFGESIVTMGGDFWEGVTDSILCGRAFGGLGRLLLANSGGCPCVVAFPSPGDVRPSDVLGRSFGVDTSAVKETCRRSTGVDGFCSVSFPRFSNLERKEETGLIELASVLSLFFSAMAKALSTHTAAVRCLSSSMWFSMPLQTSNTVPANVRWAGALRDYPIWSAGVP